MRFEHTSFKTRISPEFELLLCCAGARMDLEMTRRLGVLLQSGIDLRRVLRIAAFHRAIPLLYKGLTDEVSTRLPRAFLAELQRLYAMNKLRNLLFMNELQKIQSLFHQEGIPAVSYKGPTLAVSAYGDLAMRQFSDLDILVDAQNMPRATELLISKGYCSKPGFHFDSHSLSLKQSHREFQFLNQHNGTVVELHCLLDHRAYSYPLSSKDVWERIAWCDFADRRLSTLQPEPLILMLCWHASKHAWSRLQWVCDIARLVERNANMNWNWILKRALDSGNDRPIMLGLALASELFHTPLPAHVVSYCYSDRQIRRLLPDVKGRILDEQVPGPRQELKIALYHTAVLKNHVHKATFLLHSMCISLLLRVCSARGGKRRSPPRG